MLSILSATSLEQGKLRPKPLNEKVSRYLTAADRAELVIDEKPHSGRFLSYARGGLLARAAR